VAKASSPFSVGWASFRIIRSMRRIHGEDEWLKITGSCTEYSVDKLERLIQAVCRFCRQLRKFFMLFDTEGKEKITISNMTRLACWWLSLRSQLLLEGSGLGGCKVLTSRIHSLLT
jgi:hypothetical protein